MQAPCQTIAIDRATDWPAFRALARNLLHAGVAPEAVRWVDAQAAALDLFDSAPAAPAAAASAQPDPPAPQRRITVPRGFIAVAETACRHNSPDRFTLLYRLLWRMVHQPSLRHDPLDADVMQVRQLVRAVGRDQHHMQGFVRFRPLTHADGAPLRVAWFEPEHYVVAAVAPFFVQRFANMRWSILTPKGCAHWLPACNALPQGRLHIGPPADASQAPPPDAGEALWLTYYASTFNPARLKLPTMQRFMPRRYWHNLPEAALIGPLAQQAHERAGQMVEP